MAIRKIKRGGKIATVIDITWKDAATGKWLRKRVNAKSTNAYAIKAEERALLDNVRLYGTPFPPEPEEEAPKPKAITLADFWSDSYEPGTLALKTRATKLSYTSVWSRPNVGLKALLGDVPLHELNATLFEKAAATVKAAGRSPRPMVILLKAMLASAVDKGKLPALPRFPKGLYKDPKKLPDAPEPREARTLVESASGWLKTALVLAFYCGLRMGEVRALRVGDLDLERGFVYVRRAFSENELSTTKTCAERMIPLSPEALAYLRDATRGLSRERLLVCRKNGEPKRRQNVLTAYQRLRKSLGLQPRSFHACRHFFVSQLLATGVDLETGRSLTGHQSISSFERYAHTNDERRRQAVMAISLGTGSALSPEQLN